MCADLLDDVLTHHDWIISDFIVHEVADKLLEKSKFPKQEIADLCRFLRNTASVVEPTELDPSTCRDPKDVPVLGTAAAAHADLLISVDEDLLALGCFQGIHIVKPGEFWKRTTA